MVTPVIILAIGRVSVKVPPRSGSIEVNVGWRKK
jgi:hypothetical protein